MATIPPPLLHRARLRNTAQRQSVIAALGALSAATPQEITMHTASSGKRVNIVTVYRVLDALVSHDLAHRHPDGRVSLCTLPDSRGHHAFLRCAICGKIEEFHARGICAVVRNAAHRKHFRVAEHMTAILGTCAACTSDHHPRSPTPQC